MCTIHLFSFYLCSALSSRTIRVLIQRNNVPNYSFLAECSVKKLLFDTAMFIIHDTDDR